ncbi:hypothetical protein DPEC_G00167090 [Dallia pectoralis]|uniref:Uncharacterized protein n=1 Tax=Dallia pectoralis TaxID=75939 RepID=A0ACC2GIA0_DALPE|nr:hypothetical protein DPEC_G00167090 [Dallia pectoralis]
MGRTCCVVGCNVRSHDRQGKKSDNVLSFFSFPGWRQNQGSYVSEVTKRRRLSWISAVRRKDIMFCSIPRWLKVCSRHFYSGKPAYEMDESNPDWAPTLHLGHSEVRATESDRYRRLQRQQMTVPVAGEDGESQMQGETTAEDEEAHEKEDDDQAEAEVAADVRGGEQTEVGAVKDECGEWADVEGENMAEDETTAKRQRTECQFCERNSAKVNRLLQENRELRCELNKRKMDEDFLKGNSNKVCYYTGIPCFAILLSVLTNVVDTHTSEAGSSCTAPCASL